MRPGPATAPASAHGTASHRGRRRRWWRATASGTRCGDGAYIDAECRRSYILDILDVHPFRIYIYMNISKTVKICQDILSYFEFMIVYVKFMSTLLNSLRDVFFSDSVPAGSCRFDVPSWMNQSTISAPAKGIGEGSYVGERGRDT